MLKVFSLQENYLHMFRSPERLTGVLKAVFVSQKNGPHMFCPTWGTNIGAVLSNMGCLSNMGIYDTHVGQDLGAGDFDPRCAGGGWTWI